MTAVEKQPSILSRLFVFDDSFGKKKYVAKSIPCSVSGHVCYVNVEQKIFAIQFDRSHDQQLIKEVHDHFASKPIGERFSGKTPVDIAPTSIKIGKFAGAYIDELRHICRVQILHVNREREEAEVLAIDVGAVAIVKTCHLFALPSQFKRDQYRTALALVCRLPFSGKSRLLTVKRMWLDLHLEVFVLSSTAPHMALACYVGDPSFVDVILRNYPKTDSIRYQRVFDDSPWTLIDRRDYRRQSTYAPTPSHPSNEYVATVVSVVSIKAIHVRDFDNGVLLVEVQKAINRQYSDADFRAGMALLPDEVAPGLGIVFTYDDVFYRGVVIDELPDDRIWIESLDYPGAMYKLPIEDVFNPAYELLQIPPLVRTIDLSDGLSPAVAIEKMFIAAKELQPGMVVDVSVVNGWEQITLPNGCDFQELLELPRSEKLQPLPTWTPESSMSSKAKPEKDDVSLYSAAVELAEKEKVNKHKELIRKFEALTTGKRVK